MMSTECISLNMVENATSDKLSKEDLRKEWGRLEKRWNRKNKRGQSRSLHQVVELQTAECKTEANKLVGFLRKNKQNY